MSDDESKTREDESWPITPILLDGRVAYVPFHEILGPVLINPPTGDHSHSAGQIVWEIPEYRTLARDIYGIADGDGDNGTDEPVDGS